LKIFYERINVVDHSTGSPETDEPIDNGILAIRLIIWWEINGNLTF
jgi:hypothetical protein